MTASDQGWMRRLWGYIGRHRRNVIIAVVAALLGSGAQALVPLISRQIVDKVIIARSSALWPWLLLLFIVAGLSFGLAYLRRYRGGLVGLGVQLDLRNDMHERLVRLDLTSLSQLPTGQLVSRASSDSALVQGLLNFLPLMLGNLVMALAALVIMLVLSPLLALIGLVTMPALFVVSYRMRVRVFPATWEAQQREGDVAQIVDEDVNGVRVVKAFGQEQRELGRLTAAAQRLFGSRMRAVRLQARYQPLLEAIPGLAQVAVLATGGYFALSGRISIGTFLAFSTYVGQFAAPARQLAGVLTVGQQARAGAERIFQILDLQPKVADHADAVILGPLRGDVEFRAVSFGYTDDEVLSGIDLHVHPGERVALVGPSGSGKSSVAALIPRFYDVSSGAVLVDGHDVRDVTLESLRSQIAIAFEESFLFSDTIRANIAYGRPDATDAQIAAAAHAAQATEFIDALPQGYDTVVGERGLTLSGGQRQRIALARAIIADPAVLILDDATSAIDAQTEEAIHEQLRTVLSGRTTLLVAHRVSTLHLADRVVVLDKGRIVESGTHDELFERSAFYRGLLSGIEETTAAAIGDRIEALASVSTVGVTEGVTVGVTAGTTAGTTAGITADAWRAATRGNGALHTSTAQFSAPSLGPGLGGGGGGGSWRLNLAPTPELLARVDQLRPVADSATVDMAEESKQVRGFGLAKLLRAFRVPLSIGLGLVVIDALLGIAGPALVKTGVDNGVTAHHRTVLFVAAALLLLVNAVDLLNQVASTFITGRTAERIMLSLRIRIFAQLQRLSMDYYEREMAGRIMTRMTTDVDQFESLVENGLLSALVSLVTFLGVGVTLVVIDPTLGLATLSVVVPLTVATLWFRRRSSRVYTISRERISAVNADFQEGLSGVREAQAAVHETLTVARFRELGASYLRSRAAAQRLVATYFPFVQFLSAVADAIVLGVGAQLIRSGQLTVGDLIAFLLYVDMFFSPIQQLSQVFDSWQQTQVSVRRIADLMELQTLTPQPESPVRPASLTGAVELADVTFGYSGSADQLALRGVTLTVAAGETVALVGETGAGKSTLVKLIARFYDPVSGSVSIDGIDLRDLDLTTFRSHLGYVPQEPFLFTGTIRDNIAYGRPDATDAEIEAAAHAVGAHDVIAALPNGYLSELAERGASLSAGQRQLIALARAQLADPTVMLLDEATANLDLATEARVTAAMHQVSRDRTTILIAHRLQTARTADRIAVLDHGRITEVGTHEELLACGGAYHRMWQAFELVSSS